MQLHLGPLWVAALAMGLGHTVLGPDHYLPFVAMSRAGRWSRRKTLLVTLLCGLGHVGGSVALGLVGIAIGAAVFQAETVEATRGEITGWLLVAFGAAYLAYGLVRAIRNQPHDHLHSHDDGTVHSHGHVHQGEHLHVHEQAPATASTIAPAPRRPLTPWVLFTLFVLGPCEPLIPMFMYPAAHGSLLGVISVTAAYTVGTLLAMLGMVAGLLYGVKAMRLKGTSRYSHAYAGLAVLACGLAIKLGM